MWNPEFNIRTGYVYAKIGMDIRAGIGLYGQTVYKNDKIYASIGAVIDHYGDIFAEIGYDVLGFKGDYDFFGGKEPMIPEGSYDFLVIWSDEFNVG